MTANHKQNFFVRELRPHHEDNGEIRRELLAGRWVAAGLGGRCFGRSAVCGAEDAGRTHAASMERRCAGHDRRPGHVPMDKIKEQVDMEVKLCDGARVLCVGGRW